MPDSTAGQHRTLPRINKIAGQHRTLPRINKIGVVQNMFNLVMITVMILSFGTDGSEQTV